MSTARTEIPRCLFCAKQLRIVEADRWSISFWDTRVREDEHYETKEHALRAAKSEGLVVNGAKSDDFYDEDLDDFTRRLNSGRVYVSLANPRRGLWGLGHFCSQRCAASYGEDAAARYVRRLRREQGGKHEHRNN